MLDVGPIHLDPIEGIWIVLNGTTFVVTVLAWWSARTDRRVVALKNGRIREIATAGNVRREVVRAILQLALLSLVIPGLFSERPVVLSWPVLSLMAIAVLMFANTAGDYRDRRRITTELYRGKR